MDNKMSSVDDHMIILSWYLVSSRPTLSYSLWLTACSSTWLSLALAIILNSLFSYPQVKEFIACINSTGLVVEIVILLKFII